MKDKNVHPDKQKEIEQRNLDRLRKEKIDGSKLMGMDKQVLKRHKGGAYGRK